MWVTGIKLVGMRETGGGGVAGGGWEQRKPLQWVAATSK